MIELSSLHSPGIAVKKTDLYLLILILNQIKSLHQNSCMQKFILFCLCFITAINLQAQTRTSNNSSLDTLKENIKAIGNLFKKAGAVTVTINGIDSNDNNLTSLQQNIQRITGVKKIKYSYEQNKALFMVSYKGKGTELWQAVPQSSKKMFSLITLTDTIIQLNYKYAKTSALQNANANPGS